MEWLNDSRVLFLSSESLPVLAVSVFASIVAVAMETCQPGTTSNLKSFDAGRQWKGLIWCCALWKEFRCVLEQSDDWDNNPISARCCKNLFRQFLWKLKRLKGIYAGRKPQSSKKLLNDGLGFRLYWGIRRNSLVVVGEIRDVGKVVPLPTGRLSSGIERLSNGSIYWPWS